MKKPSPKVCAVPNCQRTATRWASTVGMPSGVHAICGICCRSKIKWYQSQYPYEADVPPVIQVDPYFDEDFTTGYDQTLPLMVWSLMREDERP